MTELARTSRIYFTAGSTSFNRLFGRFTPIPDGGDRNKTYLCPD